MATTETTYQPQTDVLKFQESQPSSTEILSVQLIQLLKDLAGKNKPTSITFVEGASRGNAALNFTQIGSTQFFAAGFITPTAESMINLGVNKKVLADFGKDSPQAAGAMIDAVQSWYPHDIVVTNTANLYQVDNGVTPVNIAVTIPNNILYRPVDSTKKDVLYETTLALPGNIPASEKAQMISHYQIAKVMELLTGKLPDIDFKPEPNDDYLMEEVVKLAIAKNVQLMTIESCLGGSVSQAIANVPGSEQVFSGTTVVYSDESKRKILQINNHGVFDGGWVYSRWTAETMAMFYHNGQHRLMVNSHTGQLERPDLRKPKPFTVYSANKYNDNQPQSITVKLNRNPKWRRRDLKRDGVRQIAQFMGESLDQIHS